MGRNSQERRKASSNGRKEQNGELAIDQTPDAGQELLAAQNQGGAADAQGASASKDEYLLYGGRRWPSIDTLKKSVLTPVGIRPFSFKAELGPMFAVFSFALMLYGLTAPREVALEDDGLFLMLLEFFGVGHPPGYPLYTILGTPFFKLLPDFLPPAYRGHLFSSFAGAVACVALYAIIIQIVRSRYCALIAAIAYACSEIFWSQAIIAEVYTLNAALYFVLLALCLSYGGTPRGKKPSMHLYAIIAFLYGLSLTNHWPLIGLGSVTLLFVVLSQWRSLMSRAAVGILLLTAGLLPYAWMIYHSHSDVALNFYGPIEDLSRLWFYVTRSGYSGVDQQTGVGLEEKLLFTSFFFTQLAKQVTPLGLAVSVAGLYAMLRTREHLWLAIAMMAGWVMTGPLLIYLVDFQAEFIWFSAFRVYFLPCYGFMLIWFGYGLAWIGSHVQQRLRTRTAAVATGSLGAVVVALSLVIHWSVNDRSDYTWARDLALFKLTSAEQNAHMFTFDDLDLPVGYLNLVEKVRPDIKIYNDQGLVFGRRLYSPFTQDKDKTKIINDFIRKTSDPIYYHPFRKDLFDAANNGTDFLGFWRRVNQDDNSERIVLTDRLLFWVEDNVRDYAKLEDRWTRQQAAGQVATLINGIAQASSNGYPLNPKWHEVIADAYNTNEIVHLLLLWNLDLQNAEVSQASEELAWIDSVVARPSDYIFDNSNFSDLLLLRSKIIYFFPELATESTAAEEYEKSLLRGLEHDFKYTVFLALTEYYRGVDRQQDAIDLLKEKFGAISKAPVEFRRLNLLLERELKEGRQLRPVLKFES